jgi:hypothetical protein
MGYGLFRRNGGYFRTEGVFDRSEPAKTPAYQRPAIEAV